MSDLSLRDEELKKLTKAVKGSSIQHQKREKPKNLSDSKHVIRKRVPPRLPHRDKDYYVTNKSDINSQLTRCEKLLESETEVIIHGLGAAVTRAINIALQLRDKHHGTVEVDVNTSTVNIVDDCEPLDDSGEYTTQTRQNSSVHIRVFRTALLGAYKTA